MLEAHGTPHAQDRSAEKIGKAVDIHKFNFKRPPSCINQNQKKYKKYNEFQI